MEFLTTLWLPILLTTAAVWLISMIASMALPHHKQDFIALPDEDGFMADLRTRGIKPGNYIFPDFRDPKSMKTPKVEKALNEGPVGHLSVWNTPLTMADKMIGTFVVYLVATTLIAYLARIALPGAAPFAKVFQIAATAGVLAYCFAHLPSAIWWGSYRRTIIANIADGILYGVITGAIFAWLWPH